jgi:hypothetical protein
MVLAAGTWCRPHHHNSVAGGLGLAILAGEADRRSQSASAPKGGIRDEYVSCCWIEMARLRPNDRVGAADSRAGRASGRLFRKVVEHRSRITASRDDAGQ